MIAIDTNVLVYAHAPGEPHHEAARAAVERIAGSASIWGLPVPCVVEFIRVSTHPRVYAQPLARAVAAIDALLAAPGVRLFSAGADAWTSLRASLLEGAAAGNLAFDAHIAAVCRSNGCTTLLTEDRDFARFRGLRVVRLSDDLAPFL